VSVGNTQLASLRATNNPGFGDDPKRRAFHGAQRPERPKSDYGAGDTKNAARARLPLAILYIHQLLPAISHKQKFSIAAQVGSASGTLHRSDFAAASFLESC
jgi:hypothetical protein